MEIKPIASGSTGNAYWISDEKTALLLDAGISFSRIQQEIGFTVSGLSGALITHRHGDHTKAVKDLIKHGVDIYSNQDVITSQGIAEHHRAHVLQPNRQYEVGTFIVLPFSAVHDVPCFAYILYSKATMEKLLYITDSQYCPVRVPGLTHIIMETNYDEDYIRDNVESGRIHRTYKNRVLQTHMSIETAKKMLESNDLTQLKEVYICHLSDNNSIEDEFKQIIQKASAALVTVC